MASKEKQTEIIDLLKETTNFDIDKMTSNNSEWGSLNFEEARGAMEQIQSLLSPTINFDFSEIPEAIVDQMINVTTNVNDTLEEIAEFSLEVSDPSGTRDNLTSTLQAQTEALIPKYGPWLPFLAYRAGNIQDSLNKVQKSLDNSQQELHEAQKYAKGKKEEIDIVVEAAKNAAADAGVQTFTQDFDGQATNAKEESKAWLIAAATFAGLTILTAFLFIFFFKPTETDKLSVVIQITASKIVMIGVLFAATLWCGKIFKALRHQYSVNKHKAQALKTFQAFVEATDDPQIRDAVLMETTRSIFSAGTSGYLEGEIDRTASSSSVVEVMKSISSNATKE